ncbi:uncharacterized protein LOC131667634 [Phymastichus coffea]|uniref:uncharacterized protein LOC131667634 n=1 Tax=Phymastichus coffea TaxID=108790 RepID=UPI00273BC0E4|nr:uncharacterized protein LOC131667634 [Phymastichus coffea]
MKCCIVLCVLLAVGTKAVTENEMLNQCSELMTQHEFDLTKTMGKWYVVEVIEHKADTRTPPTADTNSGGQLATRFHVVDVCPVVNLRLLDTQGPPRISLLWEERLGNLEYVFWLGKTRGNGIWNCDVIQNGTLADRHQYTQFVGTVHVMKAVGTHMVLTFCPRNVEAQKFTVLVSRTHHLHVTEVRGVRDLLRRRKLPLLSIRESCAQGTATIAFSSPIVAMVTSILWLLLCRRVFN